jgi:hypothetical protein
MCSKVIGCVTRILELVTEVGKQEIPLKWRLNAMVVRVKPVRTITRKHGNNEDCVMISFATDSAFFRYVCHFLTVSDYDFLPSNTLPGSIPKQIMCYAMPVTSHVSLRLYCAASHHRHEEYCFSCYCL